MFVCRHGRLEGNRCQNSNGWATKDIADGPAETPAYLHDWEELGREGLGWTGDDYSGGRGEAVSQVTYLCRHCGEVKIEKENS